MTDIMTKTDIQLREKGNWAVYYTSPPKFYNSLFLFVDLTILGTLVNFCWLFQCSNVATTNFKQKEGEIRHRLFLWVDS